MQLEKRARRTGYTAAYPDGLVPHLVDPEKGDKGHGLPKGEEDGDDEYKVTFDIAAMERWMRDDMGIKVSLLSEKSPKPSQAVNKVLILSFRSRRGIVPDSWDANTHMPRLFARPFSTLETPTRQ